MIKMKHIYLVEEKEYYDSVGFCDCMYPEAYRYKPNAKKRLKELEDNAKYYQETYYRLVKVTILDSVRQNVGGF